uniref:Zinc knuckle CX2CX4HX4C domain-containing protein n=1 Tax=Cannabis sativa TaxID=3483 RepID=A0A803PE26_CANSA
MDEFLNTVSNTLVFPSDENNIFTYDASSSSSTPATISLLLKLHTIRPYNRPSLMKTLSGIWSSQCRFPVSVTEHADGLFLVTFGCEGDKGRILEGQPWHFAQSITIFAAPESSFPITPDTLHYVPFWIQVYGIPFMCKSFDLARFIATEVGDLIEVDKDTVKEGTGPYLRLRILLDVNLPIRRGMNIRFIRMGREFVKWIDFKYERHPDFCFFCGKLDHTKRYCHFYLQKCDESQSEPPCPYTILLRGKEKIVDKSMPFQYPHPPAITVVDHAPVNLNLPTRNFLDNIISFPSFLAATGISGPNFLSPYTSSTVMIPTPLNPNSAHVFPAGHNPFGSHSSRLSAFTSYSTYSLVIATTACTDVVASVVMGNSIHSTVEAVSASPAAVVEAQAEAGQPDSLVRGKGLASTSGVKRPSFTPQQVIIGGSVRSQLKRARAGDREEESSFASTDMEQAGDALHTRPEKMSLMCWNARGLGSTRAFRRLSLLVKTHCLDVLFFD